VNQRIVRGPTPTENGTAIFIVETSDRMVEVSASPLGIGLPPDIPLEPGNAALNIVSDYIREHEAEELDWYRDAARLRRAAGRPALAGNTREPQGQVVGALQRRESGAILAVVVSNIEIRVAVSATGGLMDDTDDWERPGPRASIRTSWSCCGVKHLLGHSNTSVALLKTPMVSEHHNEVGPLSSRRTWSDPAAKLSLLIAAALAVSVAVAAGAHLTLLGRWMSGTCGDWAPPGWGADPRCDGSLYLLKDRAFVAAGVSGAGLCLAFAWLMIRKKRRHSD
jgi:hypothetical protein